MKNKVIINGRFLLHKITGVERYARELCFELDKIVEKNEVEIAIPPDIVNIPKFNNIKVNRVGKLKNRLWEHISFPIYVFKKRAISVNLCNVSPLISPGIVCIHDVKINVRPSDFSKMFVMWYKLLFRNSAFRAKRILTVSEFTKRELIKYYNIKPSSIEVISNGWQHYNRIDYDDKAIEKYQLIKKGYYFSMCSLEPNKNFQWIAENAKINPNELFIVAGSINREVFSDGLGFECPSNMKLIGYVTDEEAKTLMRYCKAFLFPSFYEGFGIPPLEAFSAGAPKVVVSDIEVMHEIFGESVVYINPKLYNQSWMKKEPSKSFDLNRFSWNESAKKLYRLCKNIQ